ncbi:MAG TPA: flagellar hook-basal body complex protein FliE [Candidatus Dormibacteraeota bacterium]|nr:flagellar hook-basal body complex protein FliE [Candidatus Dormibacteraeota bacterium]
MNTMINGITPQSVQSTSVNTQTSSQAQGDFANLLKQSIENMNDVEAVSDQKTAALVNGDIEDLHEVMIAAQKSSITVEATVQVQKKVIDAYNEIMRMQV